MTASVATNARSAVSIQGLLPYRFELHILQSRIFTDGTQQGLRILNRLIRILRKTENAMRAYQLPVEEPCPVPERLLGDLYRASPDGLGTLVRTIPATSRALLALYCFKRVHLKSIALALAETCSKDDLIVHGGDFGADLYERAR